MSIDHSAPLRGIVICCTSIPDEKRTAIASCAEQMGALHQLDLTRDVTHLIIGSTETLKYKYVAKNRQDIMPMNEGWIEAIRDLWIADKEINLEALEQTYKFPTFQSSRFSMTGCEDPKQRLDISELVKANGATYEGDLTRSITHLISLRTDGAKYKAARSWGLKIVSIDWLYQSLERGMMLEEKLFDPSLPKEEQGKGAWNRNVALITSSEKRSRTDSVASPEAGKRKLRRTASIKLSSQYDKIWADISGGGVISQTHKSGIGEAKKPELALRGDETSHNQHNVTIQNRLTLRDEVPKKAGVFLCCRFWFHNFPGLKIKILQNHILSNDGEVMHTIGGQTVPLPDSLSEELLSYRLFLIVPHDLSRSQFPPLPEFSPVEVVTIWWIERCLHHKKFMEPKDHVIGRPFPVFPIPDIAAKNMILCSSAFTGIDLLHLTRAVELIGATYSDFMTPNSTLLIVKSVDMIRKDKMNYALEWKIPIVTANWLWDSIEAGKGLPTVAYEFQSGRRIKIQPKEDLTNKIKSQTVAPANLEADIPFKALKKSPDMLNHLPSQSTHDHSIITTTEISRNNEAQFHAFSKIPKSIDQESIQTNTEMGREASYPQHSSKDMRNAISSLLAKSKGTLNNQITERTETRKRSRILGRVTSNTSNQSRATSVDSTATYGHPVHWPSNSSDQTANERIDMLINGDKTRMIDTDDNLLPSTQLEYKDPDSTVASEVLMARIRGEAIDVEKIRNSEKKGIMGVSDSPKTAVTRRKKRRGSTNV